MPEGSPAAAHEAPSAQDRLVTWGLGLFLVIPFATLAGGVVARRHLAGASANDISLTEIAVRWVGTGSQLVGPYSRYRFRHPGPLPFYALWPSYEAFGRGSAGLYFGAVIVNLAASIGIVAILHRSLGRLAAVGAAIGIVLLVAGDARLVAYPWNPFFIALPVACVVVAAAAAVSRSAWYLVIAGAGGSFVVQSHVGVLPTVLAVGGVGAVGAVVRHRRRAITPILAASGLVALLWFPPLYQQLTEDPGNLGVMLNEMRSGNDRIPADEAFHLFARGVTSLPFAGSLGADVVTDGSPWRTLATLALIGLLFAAVCAAVRSRAVDRLAFAGVPLVALCAAGASMLGVRGEPHAYLAFWIAGVSLAGSAAVLDVLGSALTERTRAPLARRGPRLVADRVAPLVVAVLVVGSTVIAVRSLAMAPGSTWVFDDARGSEALAAEVVSFLSDRDGERVAVDVTQENWEAASVLVNRLDGAGFDVTVPRQWTFMFGDQFEPDRRPDGRLVILAGGAASGSEGRIVATGNGVTVLWRSAGA